VFKRWNGVDRVLKILLLLCWLERLAEGQPVSASYKSLEAQVAEAEWVFRGRVMEVSQTILIAPGGYETNISRTAEGKVISLKNELALGKAEYALRVNVDEKFKGPEDIIARLVYTGNANEKRFEEWAEKKRDFLWFVPRSPGSEGQELSWIGLDADRYGQSEDHRLPVFSMKFECLTKEREILERVRELSKREFPNLKFHRFQLPATIAEECHPGRPYAWLVVPVCGELEKVARQLIVSPEDFSPGVRDWERGRLKAEGIQALHYFKSDENADLLKTLLTDESFFILIEHDEQTEGKRVYDVRERARDVLRAWGIKE